MDTVNNANTKQVHRLEVFTGAGRRRKWSAEDKVGIVGEIGANGDSVSAVARRHGLSPQQLFGWRKGLQATENAHRRADDLLFVPAVVDASAPVRRRRKMHRRQVDPEVGLIEVEIDGVLVRIGQGADAKTVAAIVHALKAPR